MAVFRLQGDDERPVGAGRDGGARVAAVGGERVDLELPALRRPGGVVALGVDVGTAGAVGLPDDDEVAVGVHGRGGGVLVAGGGGVHAERRALRHAACVVTLGVDVPVRRAVGLPRDDEVAV